MVTKDIGGKEEEEEEVTVPIEKQWWVERRKEVGGAGPALYKYVNESSFLSGSFPIFGHSPFHLFFMSSHPSSHPFSGSSLTQT